MHTGDRKQGTYPAKHRPYRLYTPCLALLSTVLRKALHGAQKPGYSLTLSARFQPLFTNYDRYPTKVLFRHYLLLPRHRPMHDIGFRFL